MRRARFFLLDSFPSPVPSLSPLPHAVLAVGEQVKYYCPPCTLKRRKSMPNGGIPSTPPLSAKFIKHNKFSAFIEKRCGEKMGGGKEGGTGKGGGGVDGEETEGGVGVSRRYGRRGKWGTEDKGRSRAQCETIGDPNIFFSRSTPLPP